LHGDNGNGDNDDDDTNPFFTDTGLSDSDGITKDNTITVDGDGAWRLVNTDFVVSMTRGKVSLTLVTLKVPPAASSFLI
jgi:hypothetical protein